jgi:general secretion pathway protein N
MARSKLMRDPAYCKRTVVILFMIGVGLAPAASQERPKTLPGMASANPITPSGDQRNQLSVSPGIAGNISADFTKLQRFTEGGNPLWAVPLASLNATRERPIFSPSRRPSPIAERLPTQPATVRPQLTRVGAILGDDEVAILQDEITRGIARVKKGESYAGWTLHVLEQRKAILQKGSDAMILMLRAGARP